MTSGEINMAAAKEVHPLKSIGCFIKKPITAEQLLGRIRAELEQIPRKGTQVVILSFLCFLHANFHSCQVRHASIGDSYTSLVFPATDIYPSTKPIAIDIFYFCLISQGLKDANPYLTFDRLFFAAILGFSVRLCVGFLVFLKSCL